MKELFVGHRGPLGTELLRILQAANGVQPERWTERHRIDEIHNRVILKR